MIKNKGFNFQVKMLIAESMYPFKKTFFFQVIVHSCKACMTERLVFISQSSMGLNIYKNKNMNDQAENRAKSGKVLGQNLFNWERSVNHQPPIQIVYHRLKVKDS